MPSGTPIDALTAASLRWPRAVVAGAVVLAAAGAWLASGLEIRSSYEELLPPDLPSVAHAREVVRRVGGDGTVLVNVEALTGPAGLPDAEAWATRLAADYRALGPAVIRSVEVNLQPVERWYADHWPMFASLSELQQARDRLRAAVAKAKSQLLSLGIEDEPGPAPDVPLLDPARPSPRQQVEEHFTRYPGGFMVAPDRRSVTILVRPAATSLSITDARNLLGRMRGFASAHRDALEAAHLRVGYGGTFPILVAEYDAVVHDIGSTFLLVLSVVLLSLVLYYRSIRPVAALAAAILVAVAITFGLARLAIGFLNTQTAFLGAILVGNGINYGLIYLARLTQLRRAGIAVEPAVRESARAAWRAALLASIATAVSFGTLVVATNRGFRHFGLIGGVGMLLCWISTFALVPALVSLMERIHPRRPGTARPERPVPGWLATAFRRPGILAGLFGAAAAVSVALFLVRLPDMMERNLNRLSRDVSRDRELVRENARAHAAMGQSVAGVIALLPSQAEADAYCRVVRERAAQPRWKRIVEGCETLSSVVPDDQPQKLAVIHDIARRLSPAVVGQLPRAQAARARQIRADLVAQRPLGIAEAPQVLVDRFRERDGTVGRIAFVRARPDAKLELGPNMSDFVAAVRDVPVNGRRYDAAGESIVVADLLDDVQTQGPTTTFLSFLGVCALVLVFLRRSLRLAVQVLASLVVGVALLAGVAALTGLKINFFNFIVYPITFGIAVDYGANVATRAAQRESILAGLAEVGPAVALCSWTTIVGYGSLLLAANRALRSFGWYAMAGEVTTLAAALVLLPALALLWSSAGRRSLPGRQRPADRRRPFSLQEESHAD